jgi:succinate dehydrogenase/fumarate reductase-like Fe-S protein
LVSKGFVSFEQVGSEKKKMDNEMINVKLFRYGRSKDKRPYCQNFEVPFEPSMNAMNALDYIYQSLDGSFAYYDHAGCALGICARCTGKVRGKLGL